MDRVRVRRLPDQTSAACRLSKMCGASCRPASASPIWARVKVLVVAGDARVKRVTTSRTIFDISVEQFRVDAEIVVVNHRVTLCPKGSRCCRSARGCG